MELWSSWCPGVQRSEKERRRLPWDCATADSRGVGLLGREKLALCLSVCCYLKVVEQYRLWEKGEQLLCYFVVLLLVTTSEDTFCGKEGFKNRKTLVEVVCGGYEKNRGEALDFSSLKF